MIHPKQKPFGINMSTTKSDKYNLYVTKVDPDSIAMGKGVTRGTKLVALNGESIEGIGAKEIFRRLKTTPLPLDIMFRRRNRRKSSLLERSESGGEVYGDVQSSEDELYEPGTPEVTGIQKTPTFDAVLVTPMAPMELNQNESNSSPDAGNGNSVMNVIPNVIRKKSKSNKKVSVNDDTSSDDDDDNGIYQNNNGLLMSQNQSMVMVDHIGDNDFQSAVDNSGDVPSSDDDDGLYKKKMDNGRTNG